MPKGIYKRAVTPATERFSSKYTVDKSGCWCWSAAKTSDGYGQFWGNDSYVYAHRFSYEMHRGNIPSGLVIDHLCRNPSCVNPEHLECVTMKENTRRGILFEVKRMKAKKQTHCKRGHALFGENLIVGLRGNRTCKKCQRDKANEWRDNNKHRCNELQRKRRSEK